MLTDSTCVSCRVSTARSLIGMIVNAFACMARSVDRAPRTAAAAAAVDVACTGSVPWEGQLSDPGHGRPWMPVESLVLAQKPRCGGPIALPWAADGRTELFPLPGTGWRPQCLSPHPFEH